MTNLELRNKLVTVLADVLGSYRTNDGTVAPAINIGPKVAPGLSVEGLEVVIQPTPEVNPVREYGGRVGVVKVRSFLLKQWDHGKSMERAMELITIHFPNADPPRVLPATVETIAQAQYDIPETEDLA